MALNEMEGNCFTFLWKLENISCCLQKMGERISSPAFVVHEINHTKWNLWFYPRGKSDINYVSVYLFRDADSEGADTIEVKYEITFISERELPLTSKHLAKYDFPKGTSYGYPTFYARHNVFISRRSEFLPRDTLTIRCKIWKSVGKMTEDVQCTARSRNEIQKTSFLWNVKNFSTLEPEKKCTNQIKSKGNNMPLMAVAMSSTEGETEGSGEIVRFELSLQDQTIKFSTLKLFLIGSSGSKVECNEEEFWFDDPTQCKQISFSIAKKTLLEEKGVYLPKDTLSLLWEWAFSRGIESEETEKDHNGCICLDIINSDAENANYNKTALLNVLVDNVKSLYDEHFLSDVKLKTNTNEFPAHKFILSASSSVFKKMFSIDMTETDSNCVNIDDLGDDTINRMLLFMYTSRVEDLTWESASHLYVAADKYAIFSLKNICSSYLKDNLSPSNACEVLLLSDFHADQDLKSAAQDYILKRGKQITNSDEWKALVETNAMLAVETVCLLFK